MNEPLENVPEGFINYHGHIHSGDLFSSNHEEDVKPKSPREMYKNVSIEVLEGFKPIELV